MSWPPDLEPKFIRDIFGTQSHGEAQDIDKN